MVTRKKYTKEFKLEAVRLASEPGVSAREIAADLGISESGLHRWKKALSVDGQQAFPGNGRLKADDEEHGHGKTVGKTVAEMARDIGARGICRLRPNDVAQFGWGLDIRRWWLDISH